MFISRSYNKPVLQSTDKNIHVPFGHWNRNHSKVQVETNNNHCHFFPRRKPPTSTCKLQVPQVPVFEIDLK